MILQTKVVLSHPHIDFEMKEDQKQMLVTSEKIFKIKSYQKIDISSKCIFPSYKYL